MEQHNHFLQWHYKVLFVECIVKRYAVSWQVLVDIQTKWLSAQTVENVIVLLLRSVSLWSLQYMSHCSDWTWTLVRGTAWGCTTAGDRQASPWPPTPRMAHRDPDMWWQLVLPPMSVLTPCQLKPAVGSSSHTRLVSFPSRVPGPECASTVWFSWFLTPSSHFTVSCSFHLLMLISLILAHFIDPS